MRCDSDLHRVCLGLLAPIPQGGLVDHGAHVNFRARRREFHSYFRSQIQRKRFKAFPEDDGGYYRKLVFGHGLLLGTRWGSQSTIFPDTKDRLACSTVGRFFSYAPLEQSMHNQPISLDSPNPSLEWDAPLARP